MVKLLFAAVTISAMIGCSNPESQAIIGVEHPSLPSLSVAGVKSHELFILTSRERADNPAIMYSNDRARGVGYARVTVTIPPNHAEGMIERANSSPPDPRKQMTVIAPKVFGADTAFLADLNRALRQRPARDRTILAFVHGYNTSHTDAVLRLGQFVEDTGFKGVPVLFSWASAGRLLDYVYDLNSVLAARNDLVSASRLLGRSDATEISLVSHSMGNFLTVEAMRQAQIEGTFNRSGKLKNIILASADIDIDVFLDQMSVFDPADRRFYVLISADYKALAASRFLAHGVNRVGDADTQTLAKIGVTVIDMTAVADRNNLNHGKFAESPEMVQLIGASLHAGNTLNTTTGATLIGGVIRGAANAVYTVNQ